MKLDDIKNVLIVGLGLLGGSYAKALTRNGFDVKVITLNQDDIDYAMGEGFISGGTTEVDAELIANSQLIIFALYPHTFIEWIEQYGSLIKPGTVITDVTGVKGCIVEKVQNMLPSGVEFISAHPMAGKETCGVRSADDSIFKKANYIVTPTNKNTQDAIDIATSIGEELEFANISILSPEKHDEMIAYLSQLTHCIAVSLMTCSENEHLKEYTGDSFRDLTRIANINEDMWSELFLMNKEELLKQMDLFINEFNKLKQTIKDEDVESMKDLMRLSTKRRKYFNK